MPNTLSTSVVLVASVLGHNGAGAISVPGAKIGDIVLNVRTDQGTVDSGNGVCEGTVSVNNEVQQISASNLSSITINFMLFRPEIVVASV